MFRAALLAALLLGACTAPNPEYCGPRGLVDCPSYVPDGFMLVPIPDQTLPPDMFQCIGPGEHCSDNGEVRPGACCGNYVCFGNCRVGLHGACSLDADCAPVFVGNDRSPAICFGGQCLSQSGGVCATDSYCASGACDNAISRCR